MKETNTGPGPLIALVALLIIYGVGVTWTTSCGAQRREREKVTYTVQGTVRGIWCHNGMCDVLFEHDTKEVSTIKVGDMPPVWIGEHVRMTLEKPSADADQDVVISSWRIP